MVKQVNALRGKHKAKRPQLLDGLKDLSVFPLLPEVPE
jgi:hypothetical protein